MLYLNTSDEADFNEITSIEKITKTVIEDVKTSRMITNACRKCLGTS